jgi:hypothetical protein
MDQTENPIQEKPKSRGITSFVTDTLQKMKKEVAEPTAPVDHTAADDAALIAALRASLRGVIGDNDEKNDGNVDCDTVDSWMANLIAKLFGCCSEKLGKYMEKRYRRGGIMRFIEGHNITSEHIDNVVNMVTLVNALILTIPPGIITEYNNETWDGMRDVIDSCPYDGADDVFLEQVYNPMVTSFLGSMYAGAVGIFIALIYFFFRPSENAVFRPWWREGGMYSVLVICFFSTASAIFCVISIMIILVWFTCPTTRVCELVHQVTSGLTIAPVSALFGDLIGLFVFGVAVSVSLVLYWTI